MLKVKKIISVVGMSYSEVKGDASLGRVFASTETSSMYMYTDFGMLVLDTGKHLRKPDAIRYIEVNATLEED